eukprot:CAMPEP_0171486024 /NCGR_PEP_ID=MMETSP0958-20121227/865_1 /TAXON_ID=87120 /ORGANISM="Aurantiochytrium limacinum, Strain ATCCMYA-1381" /LENGTH=291 /DNA_ID=CAMNT_0012018867 /DNA_START=36 /DNA_END=911 /DNA_ORIENTATION=+
MMQAASRAVRLSALASSRVGSVSLAPSTPATSVALPALAASTWRPFSVMTHGASQPEGDSSAGVVEERRFTRSNLIAEYYSEVFKKSSLIFFVAGDLKPAKAQLRELGFNVMRAKSSLIKVTARKLAPEDEFGFEAASRLAKGVTNLVYLEDPLLSFVSSPERLKKFNDIVPISDVKNDIYKAKKYLVVGGFIHDEGKANSNLFFTRSGVDALVELLKKESKALPDVEGLTPHQLFQAKVVAGMRNQLGAIRTPLLKPAQSAVATVRKIPENIASTLAKVRALRQEEQGKE